MSDKLKSAKIWITTDGEEFRDERLAMIHQIMVDYGIEVEAFVKLLKGTPKRRKEIYNIIMLWNEYKVRAKAGLLEQFIEDNPQTFEEPGPPKEPRLPKKLTKTSKTEALPDLDVPEERDDSQQSTAQEGVESMSLDGVTLGEDQ